TALVVPVRGPGPPGVGQRHHVVDVHIARIGEGLPVVRAEPASRNRPAILVHGDVLAVAFQHGLPGVAAVHAAPVREAVPAVAAHGRPFVHLQLGQVCPGGVHVHLAGDVPRPGALRRLFGELFAEPVTTAVPAEAGDGHQHDQDTEEGGTRTAAFLASGHGR